MKLPVPLNQDLHLKGRGRIPLGVIVIFCLVAFFHHSQQTDRIIRSPLAQINTINSENINGRSRKSIFLKQPGTSAGSSYGTTKKKTSSTLLKQHDSKEKHKKKTTPSTQSPIKMPTKAPVQLPVVKPVTPKETTKVYYEEYDDDFAKEKHMSDVQQNKSPIPSDDIDYDDYYDDNEVTDDDDNKVPTKPNQEVLDEVNKEIEKEDEVIETEKEMKNVDSVDLDDYYEDDDATEGEWFIGEQEIPIVEESYLQSRKHDFDSWFEGNATDVLLKPADSKGPILDFAIAGYNKVAEDLSKVLSTLAPKPDGNVCTPLSKTVWYAYNSWPEQYGSSKEMRGTQCMTYMAAGHENPIKEFNEFLPKTKIFIGIKHPIIWFKDLYDQFHANNVIQKFTDEGDPYGLTKLCTGRRCRHECFQGQIFCVHKSRFHLGLARLGKTAMDSEERLLLAAEDNDGGENLPNDQIKNPIFIFDERELGHDYFWESITEYLGVDEIEHDIESMVRLEHKMEIENIKSLDFCHEDYHDLRAQMMQYSHEMATWLQFHLIPLALDADRPDVEMANPKKFYQLAEHYKQDPCGTLRRGADGKFTIQ